jgi:hypothetical protein
MRLKSTTSTKLPFAEEPAHKAGFLVVAKMVDVVEKLDSGLENNRHGLCSQTGIHDFQWVTSEHRFRKMAVCPFDGVFQQHRSFVQQAPIVSGWPTNRHLNLL